MLKASLPFLKLRVSQLSRSLLRIKMSKHVNSSSTSSLSSSGSELPTIPEASEVVTTTTASANGISITKGKYCKPKDRVPRHRAYQEKGERFEPAYGRRPISTPVEQPSRFNNSNIHSPPQSNISPCGTYEYVGAQSTITTYGPWPQYGAPSDVSQMPGSLPTVSWLCSCDGCINSVKEFVNTLNKTNGMYGACVQSNGPVYSEVIQSGFHFPSPITGKLEPANNGGGDATFKKTTTGGVNSNVANGNDGSSAAPNTDATAEAGAGAAHAGTNGVAVSNAAPVAGVPAATNGVMISQPNGVMISQPNGVMISQPNGVMISQPNGVMISQPNGVMISQPNGVMIPPPNGYTIGAPIPVYPMPMVPANGFMGNMMPAGNMMTYYNNNYWPVNMGMPAYPPGAPMMMGPYPPPPPPPPPPVMNGKNGYAVDTGKWTETNNNNIAESNKNHKKTDDVNNNEMIKAKNKKAAMELKKGALENGTAGGEVNGPAISKKEIK